jgi:hypothetical protein
MRLSKAVVDEPFLLLEARKKWEIYEHATALKVEGLGPGASAAATVASEATL